MKKALVILAACAFTVGVNTPSFAGVLKDTAGLLGASTASVIDVPQGIIKDAVFRLPLKTTQDVAQALGDKNDVGQNIAGAVVGIPVGFALGIPEGTVQGLQQAWTTGLDKPFSTESFNVSIK